MGQHLSKEEAYKIIHELRKEQDDRSRAVGPMAALGYRQLLLLGLVFCSFLFYVPLLSSNLTGLTIGRFIGFIGLQLILWQVILGSRQIVRLVTPNLLWANKLHRLMGTYGFLIIALHPLLMVSTYGLALVWPPSFASTFDIGVRIGVLAFSVLSVIWLTSAILRGRALSWRWWKRLHLLAYIIYPLLFIHLTVTGSSLTRYPWLSAWLFTINTVFLVIILLRIAGWAGLTKQRYKVVATTPVAKDVTRFLLQPLKKGITPRPGQFAYFQGWRFGEAHPFTVSHHDEASGEISFSIKAVGPYSKKLQSLQPGDTVFIDGPYGVFTKEIGESDRPVVAIVGGIGITPFIRHLEAKRIDYLFWGVSSQDDIAYKETVQKSGAKTSIVLSEQSKPTANYLAGRVDMKLLKAELGTSLSDYDFYLCGPPPMMASLYQQLTDGGVSENAIHQEKFSL